ncbi:MAG TPA: TIM barrel protein [Opitutus sp.]|nr:TIM barrel protein [Opitutus sp.]
MSVTNDPWAERFSLSQFTSRQAFLQDVSLCLELGIPAIEVCANKLSDNPGVARDQLRALRDSGLSVSSVQARVHSVFPDQMAPRPLEPEARCDAFLRAMDLVAENLRDEHPAFVLISGQAPGHDIARARDVLTRAAARLAREAAARGASIAFEPLHPVMMNTDSFVWSWEEALALAATVAHPAFGLVCDLWNVWDQPGIVARVQETIARVRLVHASDWRDGGPHRLNDRLVPGRGAIPFPAWGRMLRDSGYSGWVCLEMLSDESLADSYLHEPVGRVVDESRRHLRATDCLHAADKGRAARDVPASPPAPPKRREPAAPIPIRMEILRLKIRNLPNAAGNGHLEKALEAVPHVQSVEIVAECGEAIINHDGVDHVQLKRALSGLGYVGETD